MHTFLALHTILCILTPMHTFLEVRHQSWSELFREQGCNPIHIQSGVHFPGSKAAILCTCNFMHSLSGSKSYGTQSYLWVDIHWIGQEISTKEPPLWGKATVLGIFSLEKEDMIERYKIMQRMDRADTERCSFTQHQNQDIPTRVLGELLKIFIYSSVLLICGTPCPAMAFQMLRSSTWSVQQGTFLLRL